MTGTEALIERMEYQLAQARRMNDHVAALGLEARIRRIRKQEAQKAPA